MTRLLFGISILLLFISFQSNSPSFQDRQTDEGLDDVYKTFSQAYTEKDVSLIESIYHPDSYYLNPGDSIKRGYDAFIPGFAGMFSRAKEASIDLNIRFDIVSREKEGSMAVDIGYYHLTREKEDSILHTSVGKFITVLRKQADGSWKFTADGYSDVRLN